MSKKYSVVYFNATHNSLNNVEGVADDVEANALKEMKELRALGLSDIELQAAAEIQILHKSLQRAVTHYNSLLKLKKRIQIPEFKIIRMKSYAKSN